MFFVYILFSSRIDHYYVGYTNNLERRISEHNRKKGKYTDRGIPWCVVHTEKYTSKKEAEWREKFIKNRKSRAFIQQLICSEQ